MFVEYSADEIELNWIYDQALDFFLHLLNYALLSQSWTKQK